MRKIAAFPSEIPQAKSRLREKEFAFRTATPVFGGGVETRALDSDTPVRGTTVRGHLRFWWRATRGRAFSDYRALREQEFAIWGDTKHSSRVAVEVKITETGSPAEAKVFVEQHEDLKYVLFPFVAPPPTMYWPRLAFTIRIQFPGEYEADVEAALWAWANFGGIGPRTRRGCGAIFCADFAPPSERGFSKWMQEQMGKYVKAPLAYNGQLREWASLPWPALTNPGKAGPPLDAWKDVVRLMSDFRQAPPTGRRGTRGNFRTYSRSNWPEADSLRKITGRGIPEHMDTLTISEAFPRAELGLPIIAKFRSRSGSPLDSANDCTISPLESSRVASPLILRPIALGPKGERAVPAIVWVSRPGLSGVRIEFRGRTEEKVGAHYVTDPRMASYANSPIGPPGDARSANGSAVEAFVAFSQEKGYGF